MNIRTGISNFFKKHTATPKDDFTFSSFSEPDTMMTGIVGGVAGAGLGAAVGYQTGKNYGLENYAPGEQLTLTGRSFVKTGTETYMGYCHGWTSGGESVTMPCTKVRDTGYYRTYTYKKDAVEHHAENGMAWGIGLGAVAGIAAGVLAPVALNALRR